MLELIMKPEILGLLAGAFVLIALPGVFALLLERRSAKHAASPWGKIGWDAGKLKKAFRKTLRKAGRALTGRIAHMAALTEPARRAVTRESRYRRGEQKIARKFTNPI